MICWRAGLSDSEPSLTQRPKDKSSNLPKDKNQVQKHGHNPRARAATLHSLHFSLLF